MQQAEQTELVVVQEVEMATNLVEMEYAVYYPAA